MYYSKTPDSFISMTYKPASEQRLKLKKKDLFHSACNGSIKYESFNF